MGERTSHYDLLGLAPNATSIEIKTAFRALIRTAHPDKAGPNGTAGQLITAFETLSDETKREHYDAQLRRRAGWIPSQVPCTEYPITESFE